FSGLPVDSPGNYKLDLANLKQSSDVDVNALLNIAPSRVLGSGSPDQPQIVNKLIADGDKPLGGLRPIFLYEPDLSKLNQSPTLNLNELPNASLNRASVFADQQQLGNSVIVDNDKTPGGLRIISGYDRDLSGLKLSPAADVNGLLNRAPDSVLTSTLP